MKINLTGVKSTTTRPGSSSGQLSHIDAKAKPLDQNSKVLHSNSLHYKVVFEEERSAQERKINLPITSSVHLNNREVHLNTHKMNVVVQKHLIPAPGAQASILPFALSAIDNAYLEEQRAKERDAQRHVEKNRFNENTRIHLLQKMQEIEHQKEKEQEETASKIKQLLADTIEFT
jgi:hypothetical protein